jgi:hypothetical protein
MTKLRIYSCILSLVLVTGLNSVVRAQETTASEPAAQTEEEKQKEKEALEKKATNLLEQIINEVQMLKLPENRIRVQIAAGDLLWKSNEARARSMFTMAADGVAELMRNSDGNTRRSSGQLRQELVMAAAQHDAPLAYQLVTATRSPTADTDPDGRRQNSDFVLEQNLLSRVAVLDPKFAAEKAEEALEKDLFPLSVIRVLAELQSKDKDAFAKLSAKLVSRLQTVNMLSNAEAGALALSLLQAGPRVGTAENVPAAASSTAMTSSNAASGSVVYLGGTPRQALQVLTSSSFADVMGVVIDNALKTAPPSATQRAANQRGRNPGGRGPGGAVNAGGGSDADLEQNNARRLLFGLGNMLPQIDQYVPARATAVRQKLTELGSGNNQRQNFAQFNSLMQQGTADSILQAAPVAPPQVQSRLYQQAALKALEEGNADRARQIASEHLDPRTRDSVLQKVEFQLIASKVEADNMDQLRQALAQLHNDDERIDLLLQMAGSAKKDKKLALKLLGEAQRLTNRRAASYQQFEQQLSVADAFASLDAARSFEVLDPGISQLNDLLSAAAVLSGFEVNVFKDGEMPLDVNSQLTGMVARYGQQLAGLSKTDFERAEQSANKFQLAEPRLMARMAIVRNALGVPGGFSSTFGARGFVRRTQ